MEASRHLPTHSYEEYFESVDGEHLFLAASESHRLLSRSEEAELGRRSLGGDQAARDSLITHNLRLVTSTVDEYSGRGLEYADLVQEGIIGLINASEGFDPETGNKFSTYAVWKIRRAVRKAVADQASSIRVTPYAWGQMNKINTVKQWLAQELGRNPSIQEIAEFADLETIQVEASLIIRKNFVYPMRLDAPFPGDNERLGEHVHHQLDHEVRYDDPVASVVIERDRNAHLQRALSTLPPRSRSVLELKFGLADDVEVSFDDIGEVFDITGERARQVQHEALEKLAGVEGLKEALLD